MLYNEITSVELVRIPHQGSTGPRILMARLDDHHSNPASIYEIAVFSLTGQRLSQWSRPVLPTGSHSFYRGNTPAIGNFDADSEVEVAWLGPSPRSTQLPDGETNVYIFNLDGSLLSGWPRQLPGKFYFSPLAVGDLDADAREDLVVQTGCSIGAGGCSALAAFDRSGNFLPGWPIINHGALHTYFKQLALGDANSDGQLEVFNCHDDIFGKGSIQSQCIWRDAQARVLPGWPHNMGVGVGVQPVIADFDNDGQAEVVLADKFEKIRRPNNIFYERDIFRGWSIDGSLFSKIQFNWPSPNFGIAGVKLVPKNNGALQLLVGVPRYPLGFEQSIVPGWGDFGAWSVVSPSGEIPRILWAGRGNGNWNDSRYRP